MRTYTRRKPTHRYIENVHELCRLCLEKIKDQETVSLFTTESEKLCPSLTMKIMICLGLEISKEDSLPSMICSECFEKLNNYYTFRKKCAITYQTLKSHCLAIKETSVKSGRDFKEDVEYEENAAYTNCNDDGGRLAVSVEDGEDLLVVNTDQEEIVNVHNDIFVEGASENNESSVPELSQFLTSILLELGILKKQDELYSSDFSENIIELETGDGCHITFQLFENEEGSGGVECGESTVKSSQSLNNKEDQTQNGRPVCDVCGKSFANRGVLRRHGRVHTGERPYACRDCPRRFSQREVLRRHELVHQERRPYACSFCPKSFTQRGGLEAHQRSHLPASSRAFTLHRCAICPKMFLHASGLSRHMRHHNGVATSCDTCARQFRDRSSLVRHQRRAHPARDPAARDRDAGDAAGVAV